MKWIFGILISISVLCMILSFTGRMPAEHRISKEVLVLENKCIMITWDASEEDALEAISYWCDKRSKQ